MDGVLLGLRVLFFFFGFFFLGWFGTGTGTGMAICGSSMALENGASWAAYGVFLQSLSGRISSYGLASLEPRKPDSQAEHRP
jgi:hypothetical protein